MFAPLGDHKRTIVLGRHTPQQAIIIRDTFMQYLERYFGINLSVEETDEQSMDDNLLDNIRFDAGLELDATPEQVFQAIRDRFYEINDQAGM